MNSIIDKAYKIADKNNLISTVGSDFHSLNRENLGIEIDQNVFEVLEQSPDYYSDSAVRLKHLQVSYNCDLNVLSQTFIGEYETTQLY